MRSSEIFVHRGDSRRVSVDPLSPHLRFRNHAGPSDQSVACLVSMACTKSVVSAHI
jgi:hypothetical protein